MTYVSGTALEEVQPSAPVLTVGLKFLPGADKPQVNRTEQINMEGKEPDQKDALWRVATAASIVARAKHQAIESDRLFSDQRKALVLRKKYSDTVTIDSERVTIAHDLRHGDWDLRGLLVEVDWSSLWDLMVNYRSLIARGGPQMTFDETTTLLDTMIEDARRLCIRSPILFRMSTRVSVINSEHTRYGISHGPMFRTLITSKGIKEIISLSAAYYNSLDPSEKNDSTQQHIRPRFLQMIVLLLSLLNNEDLAEIKDFLEATYKLKADRRDIELLILKVVPLLSIIPGIFMKALVPAIDGFPLEAGLDADENLSNTWNIFIMRILKDGYLLPGTVGELGRRCLSWIVRWPDEGFKSTSIFNTLQYAGRLRTINNIPPVEVHPGSKCTELTVVLTDESKYVISPRDLDNIIFMTPGSYPVQETAGGKQCHDLIITETWLNGELFQAVKMTNEVVLKVNQCLASPKRSSNVVSKLVRRRPDHQPFLDDFRYSGRLFKVVSSLKRANLAVAYKAEGRKVGRIGANQTMARDVRELRAFIGHIEQRGYMADHGFFSAEKRELKQGLEKVKAKIDQVEESRVKIGFDQDLSNEPIAKCLYPEGMDDSEPNVWSGYKAWCSEHTGYLDVEALRSTIRGVKWLTGEVVELLLDREPSKLIVTPLQPVPEGYRDDEARVGDVAVLMGQYVAIGEWTERGSVASEVFTSTNYLRIVSMGDQSQSRRGRNRLQESSGRVLSRFK